MPKVLVCSTEMSQITFRRRFSGYLKSAIFVIFVSDSLWSSFLLKILVWKIVSQFVRSNRQIFIFRCISNHPYLKRRLRMLKLKKKKQTKNKNQSKDKRTKRRKNIHAKPLNDSFVRHFSIAFSPWGLIVISNISLKILQKLLPFSLLFYLLHKNPSDNYF